MNCTVCGFEMGRGAKFCTRCGAGAGADRVGAAGGEMRTVDDGRGLRFEVRDMPGGEAPSPEMIAQLVREAGVDITPEQISEAMMGGADKGVGSVDFKMNVVKKVVVAGRAPEEFSKTFTFSRTFDLKKLLYVAAAVAVGALAAFLLMSRR